MGSRKGFFAVKIMIRKITHHRPLFFLYLTVFINMIGFGMVFPLLPFYAKTFNATPLEIGLLAASFSLVQFFASPVLGRISDRFGRKPILVFGLLASTFTMFLMGAAQNLAMLFVARCIHGTISAAILPTARAYMADVTTKENRVAGMGKIGAANSFGFLFGPAFGSLLVGFGGPHIPFFAAAAVALFNAFSVFIFLRESLTHKSETLVLKEGMFNIVRIIPHLRGEHGLLFFIMFAWAFGMSNNQVAFPLLIGDKFNIGADHAGYFFTVLAIVNSSVQGFLLPRIVGITGEKGAIVGGMFAQGLGLILVAISPNVATLFLSLMTLAFGSAINRPTAEGLVSRETRTGQGTTLGIANSFESLGRVFGPLIGGATYAINGMFPFFFSAALLWFLGIVAIQSLRIKRVGVK